jgi:hypothetical protein
MISVEASGLFISRLRKLDLDRPSVFAAMQLCAAAWGQPHFHSGRGIRRLGEGVYECRMDLGTRLVFRHTAGRLLFDFAGNHDQVQAYLKNRR